MSANLYIAGQISGVEGYIESTAMGLIAGINAALRLQGRETITVPETTAHGALIRHITESESRHFQPSNINFGLFPSPEDALKMRDKKLKKQIIVERAIKDWDKYLNECRRIMKEQIEQFLRYLEVENDASKHTLRAYRKDLESFSEYVGKKTGHRDDRCKGLYRAADKEWPE